MKCELCNNPKCVLITENLRYKAQKSIYRCSECGLVFLSPKMTPEEERTFYEQEYGDIYSAEKGTTPAKLLKAVKLMLSYIIPGFKISSTRPIIAGMGVPQDTS